MFDKSKIDNAIAALKQRFGEQLSTSEAVRSHHCHTTTRIPQQWPDAVVFPKNTQEVSEAVRICYENNCPVIA
ncbi:MAG: FAD-binding oxidoreductase, partial [Alphaproteobacteria bacterium]